MYYALGHISRFLTPGSVRIGLDKPKDPFIEAVAVKLPFQDNPNLINDSIAVVILNRLVCITITLCVIFTILVSFSRDNALLASKAKIIVF